MQQRHRLGVVTLTLWVQALAGCGGAVPTMPPVGSEKAPTRGSKAVPTPQKTFSQGSTPARGTRLEH
jgi:hypothetical protein